MKASLTNIWNDELKFHGGLIIKDMHHNLAYVGQIDLEELIGKPWCTPCKLVGRKTWEVKQNSCAVALVSWAWHWMPFIVNV